ncbi:MAG: glucose-6-phosphate dehydrogenase assembly protein OpcA, partial [Rudaea sp.]
MAFEAESMTVEHGEPKKVELQDVGSELFALSQEAVGEDTRRAFGRMLTLVVYSEGEEPLETLHRLVGETVARASGRAILIDRVKQAGERDLEAYISTHCLVRGDDEMEQCAELVTLHVYDGMLEDLQNAVLSLRLQDLPLVVWWRARPDLREPFFSAMLKSADQVILDSARADADADRLPQLVSRLRKESEQVPFGDINWARLIPWRELIAQFFDTPEHLDYLERLDRMVLEYSARDRGNPAQAILITMWLATLLKWQVVRGSWAENGRNRSLRLQGPGGEIDVEIRGRVDSDAPPGWLCSVTLSATGEPPADFQISFCGENCVTTVVKLGDRVAERSLALHVPGEVTLVCEEFDARRSDRIYHQ